MDKYNRDNLLLSSIEDYLNYKKAEKISTQGAISSAYFSGKLNGLCEAFELDADESESSITIKTKRNTPILMVSRK